MAGENSGMILDHPVVDVYNQYRTARLNVRYLEAELKRRRKYVFWVEFLIAVSASSSAATAWFFQGAIGSILWKALSGLTALLTIAKPLLKLSDKIRRGEEMLVGYKALDFDLERLTISIRERKAYDDELKKQFAVALEKKGRLMQADKESEPDEALLNECYEKVLRELPEDSFYVPEN